MPTKKPAAPVVDENDGVINDGVKGPEAQAPVAPVATKPAPVAVKYDAKTKKMIREILASGRTLEGNESTELIKTYFDQMTLEDEDEDVGVQEEVAGIPNQLPPRTELIRVGGKDVQFPIHFVAAVKGGVAAYNETGKRISPAVPHEDTDAKSKLSKLVTRNNALRKTNRMPGEVS